MKTTQLIVLIGVPGSGKSTWARNHIKNKSNHWVIVNRDDIRSMLGDYWIPSREKLVTDIEDDMIQESLRNGYNVIIDATNINLKTRKRIEDSVELMKTFVKHNIQIEYKFINTPLKTAIRRDFFRGLFGGRKVGKEIIKKFYNEIQQQKQQFSFLK